MSLISKSDRVLANHTSPALRAIKEEHLSKLFGYV
jgi:hypothetical protein